MTKIFNVEDASCALTATVFCKLPCLNECNIWE